MQLYKFSALAVSESVTSQEYFPPTEISPSDTNETNLCDDVFLRLSVTVYSLPGGHTTMSSHSGCSTFCLQRLGKNSLLFFVISSASYIV